MSVCECLLLLVYREDQTVSKQKSEGLFFVSPNLLFVLSICPFNHVSAQPSSHCHCPYYCLFYRLHFYYREIISHYPFCPLPRQAWGLNPANHLRSNRSDTRAKGSFLKSCEIKGAGDLVLTFCGNKTIRIGFLEKEMRHPWQLTAPKSTLKQLIILQGVIMRTKVG